MKRSLKICLLGGLLIILLGVSIYLYKNNLINYAIISGTLAIVDAIAMIIFSKNTKDGEAIYKSNLNQILKSYDSILVKANNFPRLSDKNIIMVASIDDLIDAQLEIRKPIYYRMEVNACSFILLDSNEACVYILKENQENSTSLEIIINEIEKAKSKKDVDYSVLEDIEKTTIIKLENAGAFKVSPIRDITPRQEEDFVEML